MQTYSATTDVKESEMIEKEVINEDNNKEQASDKGHANTVASHYNLLKDEGLEKRFKSPIYYLRNFNNWVKSVLIGEYTGKLREKDYGKQLRVLDICCGKGGDLIKWQKVRNLEHVVFADIAEVSIQHCKERYEDCRRRLRWLFSAEFIVADCTKDTLRDKYKDPSAQFDLVSCQFGFHYCFESLRQARCMLKNISECLKPDGYFIGTIPDANEIVSRCRKSPNGAFGNRIFNIKLLFDPKENGYPLFGAKYDFQLEGVVDCPEFLVNFEMFQKLALEFGLELVDKAQFADFFNANKDRNRNLLHKIVCFESYPAPPGTELLGSESEYEHAKTFLDKMDTKNGNNRIGTMSRCEWEAASMHFSYFIQISYYQRTNYGLFLIHVTYYIFLKKIL